MFDFDVVTDSPEAIRLRKPAAPPRREALTPLLAPPATAPRPEPDPVPAAAE
jgi:hypothetical protein